MLIGLCGGQSTQQTVLPCESRHFLTLFYLGICAGKSAIATYLIEEHRFRRISLARTASTPAVEKSASNAHVPTPKSDNDDRDASFPDVDALLDFVTLRWRERWVTTDIWDENVVDALMRRPFFLLVSVEAPVSIRWERFRSR